MNDPKTVYTPQKNHNNHQINDQHTKNVSLFMTHFADSHFAESQFAENPRYLLIFLKRKCRWRQTKLALTVALTLIDTVTVIFFTRISLTPIKGCIASMKGIENENDGKKSLHGIRRNGIRRNGKTPYL